MKRWWTALLAFGLLAVALGAANLVADPRRLPVGSVRVEGKFRYLSRTELERALAAEVKEGFFRVDLDAVRRAAMGLAWVKQATVRRVWPDRLSVQVTERQAVGRWSSGGLVDADGERFLPPDEPRPRDLPVLDGPEGSEAILVNHLKALRQWLAPVGRPVVRVTMDARRAWRVQLAGGTVIVLGRQPSEAHLRRFAEIFPAVLQARGGEAERVDLRYPNGFAVRWRDELGTEVNGR